VGTDRGGQLVMMKPELHRRASRSRKESAIPLSKLRASEVVRTVVDHPRRLEELVDLLRDKERSIRGRAAATLARLSQSHPARLVRHLERLRETLGDDSAYVRWHLLFALGQVITRFPRRASFSLADVKARLGDEDKLVRSFACRALEDVAAHRPQLVQALYSANKEEIPPSIVRALQASDPKANAAKS
jgi:HEAT repeat protein